MNRPDCGTRDVAALAAIDANVVAYMRLIPNLDDLHLPRRRQKFDYHLGLDVSRLEQHAGGTASAGGPAAPAKAVFNAALAYGLGVELDEVRQSREFVLTTSPVKLPFGEVAAGTVAGQRWRWAGIKDGVETGENNLSAAGTGMALVNSLKAVADARPGLLFAIDLPQPCYKP